MLRAMAAKIGAALGPSELAILLADESGRLHVRATWGFPDAAAVEGLTFEPGEGISGEVARTGEPLCIEDTSADRRYLHYQGRHLADGTFLCAPIRYRGRLLGLFNVLRPRSAGLDREARELVMSLAGFVALAIRLQEQPGLRS
jgi:GAF domain-containing protein